MERFPREQKIRVDPEGTDLVFQVVSWSAFDYEYDNDVEDERDDTNKYLVKIFGVTEAGVSVSVNVLDFTPYFFIKLHHGVDKYTANKLREFVVSKLPFSLKNSLIDVNIIKKKDFWGFNNHEKFYFARFKFKNIKAYKSTIRTFYKKVEISSISREPIKYKLYESNIDPFLRMMHIRDVDPCGWIVLKKGCYEVNSGILPTHCQIDVECQWTSISRCNLEKIAPLSVASFDIECTSSHGDFPVACKNYKKTAYEIMQYFNEHKQDTGIKDTLYQEILKMFQHDVQGVFSKVFTKGRPKIVEIETKLKKNMDDIFAILAGKINYKLSEGSPSSKDVIMRNLTTKFGDYDEERGWVGMFPPLEGDPIIQVGTTVHSYGEKSCSYKSIITLGSCDPIEGVDVYECQSERELLLKWRDLIVRLDPDVMTGYNIFGFDMSYLYERAKEHGIGHEFCKIGRMVGHKSTYVEKVLSSSALGDNLLKYVDMEGRVLIDIMKVVQRDHKLDSYKLDAVANHFTKMNKHDVHPSDIFRLQQGTSADRKVIADYCVQDCSLCNHLMMKLEILANNIGMSNVCTVPLSYIFMRGQGIKIFSLVAKECRADDFLIPTLSPNIRDNDSSDGHVEDEDGYEGAIVLEPREGIYIDDPVSVLDYASLYPSSMISENLSHDSIVLNPRYDNLPGYEYLDVVYDVYEKIDDKKVKTGEKKVRFVQFPDGEKGTIPKILMKLLRQRKETRKKIEFRTVTKSDGETVRGMVKELAEGAISVTSLDGKSQTFAADEYMNIEDTYDDFQKAVLDGLQVAYKVTANSLYGQCGAKTSPIYMKDIAACTTATGRKMILMAKEFLEKNFDANIVYGDTDSIFAMFPNKDENGHPLKGKAAIMTSIKTAVEASKQFKKFLKAPHDLEYEKTFWPFVLFSKKRYCANKYEFDDEHCKLNSMGIVLKRRDNAHIVKKVYGGILDIILNEQDIKKSVTFLKETLNSLVEGKYPLDDLVITKSLRADYKDPEKIAHKVLAERMGERDPGTKPQVNDRIPFVYIQVDEKKGQRILQGNRIEHPDYVKTKNLKPDYEFYITNQIMKPVLQLYALALEDLDGYRKDEDHFDIVKKRLVREKDGDMKKVKDKLNDLREDEVKKLLFEPVLIKLQNKRNKNSMITDFFQMK
jgi:DNA polymerase elongation subunit (family B)